MLLNGSTAMAGRSGTGGGRSRQLDGVIRRVDSTGVGLRHRSLRADVADETDALARNGADQLLIAAAVADRLSRRVDAARQRRSPHDPTAPDRGDQIVLGDDAVVFCTR